MKDEIFSVLQRVGRSFMLPVAVLPIAGILLGIGASFTNPMTIKTYGLEAIFGDGTLLGGLLTIMASAGSTIFGNLPIIFAVGVAIGMAKAEREVAALAAMISFFVMHSACNAMLKLNGQILPDGTIAPGVLEGTIASSCGIMSYQMGVFGGIIVGALVGRRALAARRSLSHSLGNTLGVLGPKLRRCGTKSHGKSQERHQTALGYAAGNRSMTTPRGALALVLKHIHLSPTVYTWSIAQRLPHVIAHIALEYPHRGPPFPPEPNAYRRHAPRPRARWEAIRLNLTGPGTPSDLRRDHPGPRGITVTGTAGDLHPDSPKHAGKPRIRASPHHHLGHRLLLSVW